jgi:hypothetical protein
LRKDFIKLNTKLAQNMMRPMMEKVVIIILSTERTVSTCEVAGAACRDATRLFESTKVTGAVQPTLE